MSGTGPSTIEIRLLRYFALWTFICGVSAAPSFILALMGFDDPSDIAAMLTGIAMFIIAYTLLSVHPRMEAFKKQPFVRRTIYIGYGTRIVMSVVYPISLFADMFCGIISISLTGIEVEKTNSFVAILATTLIQGVVLNVVLLMFMAAVYGVQRLFMKPPMKLEHMCATCGYDMRATPERCPECGALKAVEAPAAAAWADV